MNPKPLKPRDYSNDALFEFEALVDLRIGVVEAMKLEFLSQEHDNPNINYTFLENSPIEYLKYLRIEFTDMDIVAECLTESAKKYVDNVYNGYLAEDYEGIIALSPQTDMCRLIRVFSKNDYIRSYVICKNDIEARYVKQWTKGKGLIKRVASEKEINLKRYARIYLSNISDLIRFKRVTCTHIAVLNYGQNFTVIDNARLLLPHMMLVLGDVNQFEIVNPYKINPPVG